MIFGSAPKNYAEMLGRVAVSTWAVLSASAAVLTLTAPQWTEALGPSMELPFTKLSVPFGYILAVGLLTFFFRLFKLHDKISDLFGIRKRYDYEHVFLPAFRALYGDGVRKPAPGFVHANRDKIMYAILYKYTNGKDPRSIDSHFVEMIWESLAGYWALVEAIAILGALSLVCLIGGALLPAGIFCAGTAVALLVLPKAHNECIAKTNAELEQVLSSEERRAEIRKALDAILG